MNQAEKIAAIAAITQVFKFYGIPSKWCPLIAVAVGVLIQYSEQPDSKGILDGILLGAMVTGSYNVLKGSAQTVLKIPKTETVSVQESDINLLEADDDRGV